MGQSYFPTKFRRTIDPKLIIWHRIHSIRYLISRAGPKFIITLLVTVTNATAIQSTSHFIVPKFVNNNPVLCVPLLRMFICIFLIL
jgi:hypothetical protein